MQTTNNNTQTLSEETAKAVREIIHELRRQADRLEEREHTAFVLRRVVQANAVEDYLRREAAAHERRGTGGPATVATEDVLVTMQASEEAQLLFSMGDELFKDRGWVSELADRLEKAFGK